MKTIYPLKKCYFCKSILKKDENRYRFRIECNSCSYEYTVWNKDLVVTFMFDNVLFEHFLTPDQKDQVTRIFVNSKYILETNGCLQITKENINQYVEKYKGYALFK